MAKEKKIVVNPPAELERRDSDVALSTEQLLGISLFARLKKKPKPEESPGTLILRRFRKGEVIARQGEAGWTAFYALTGEDVLKQVLKSKVDKALEESVKETLARLGEVQDPTKTGGSTAKP